MRLALTMIMDNAAFEDANAGLESARILRELAKKLEREGSLDLHTVWALMDVNGNRVGEARVTR